MKNCIQFLSFLLLTIGSINILSAQKAIQVKIRPLLNVRIVTTLNNNQLVLWRDALDGGSSGMATMSAVIFSGGKNPKALPDNGIFEADSSHPQVVLNYATSDTLAKQARRSIGTDSFAITIPKKRYDKVFLFCMSGNGATDLNFKMIYSDKSIETCNRILPDWYNELSASDSNLCYLAKNLGKWNKLNKEMEADHHFLHGIILRPNQFKKLVRVVVLKNDKKGVLTLWGVTAKIVSRK